MTRLPILFAVLLGAWTQEPQPVYETREKHDPNGINKWYLGREIAHVMGAAGIPWLERPQREDEENPARCIEALRLRAGDVVADLGAGSGYYTFRMAPLVGPTGRILAVEIQDEMIAELKKRIDKNKVPNVETVKCTESDPKLGEASVDLLIMVDVYHELSFPFEVMTAVRKALKPGGRVALVEFRKEDKEVPIKEVHKMSEAQIGKEMAAVGLRHLETIGILPWQHIAVYTNRDLAAEHGTELEYQLDVPEELQSKRAGIEREVEYLLRKRLSAAGTGPFTVAIGGGKLTLRLQEATVEESLKVKALLAKPADQQLVLKGPKVERLYGPGK